MLLKFEIAPSVDDCGTAALLARLQACLAANDYQQRKCTVRIQELVECCRTLAAPMAAVREAWGERGKPALTGRPCMCQQAAAFQWAEGGEAARGRLQFSMLLARPWHRRPAP